MTRFLARLGDIAYSAAANWSIPNWLERILPRLDVERVALSAAE